MTGMMPEVFSSGADQEPRRPLISGRLPTIYNKTRQQKKKNNVSALIFIALPMDYCVT